MQLSLFGTMSATISSKSFQRFSPNLIFEIKIKYPFRFSFLILFEASPHIEEGGSSEKASSRIFCQRAHSLGESRNAIFLDTFLSLCIAHGKEKRGILTEVSEHKMREIDRGRQGEIRLMLLGQATSTSLIMEAQQWLLVQEALAERKRVVDDMNHPLPRPKQSSLTLYSRISLHGMRGPTK